MLKILLSILIWSQSYSLSKILSKRSCPRQLIPYQMVRHPVKIAFLQQFLKKWCPPSAAACIVTEMLVTTWDSSQNVGCYLRNKGDKGDCNNYMGISLLSVAGKISTKVILKHLQRLSDCILPETQPGFKASRSTTDMIFTLCQLQVKFREQRKPWHLAINDLMKAFDTVSWSPLYKVLECIGCLPVLLQLEISFHEDMNICIQFDGNTSDSLKVRCGAKQGCILAPILFAIYVAALLHHAFGGIEKGIYLYTRFDGSLSDVLIWESLFADDAAIAANNEGMLQGLTDHLGEAWNLSKLTISVQKTEVAEQGTNSPLEIRLGSKTLKTAQNFFVLFCFSTRDQP